jgi:multidrug efflux pump subunit AcrA (membrane-fusion protein)
MHPTVVSDKPGDCPICFMKLVPIKQGEGETKSKTDQSSAPAPSHDGEKYVCPMHPEVVSDDENARCPECGMKLEPVAEGDASAGQTAGAMEGMEGMGTESVAGLAPVSVAPDARRRIGMKVGAVESRRLAREVRTVARIAADESRLSRVTVKVEGWVDELFVSVTGETVRKGEPLLSIYSPALVSSEEEYLGAWRSRQGLGPEADPDLVKGADDLLASARRRLELWDINESQIEHLEKTGVATRALTLHAPASGVVLERNILPGGKVMPGEVLMTVGDLGVVWADASIYESDLPYVEKGMSIELVLPNRPGEIFTGQVIFVSPTVDPDTRTMIARLEIANRGLLLKPGMYGDARLSYDLGETLAIPESAVMSTGERSYAFREAEDGRLVPTLIEVGPRSNGWFELRSGLSEGDRVVTSANFLIDSESSLKSALEALSEPVGGAADETRPADTGGERAASAGHGM